MNTTDTAGDLKKLAEMIKEIKFTMMSTVSEDGSVHSRPMANQEIDPNSFDGNLWFFSGKNSLKNHSIENDQHVNLAYANPDKQRYVSISGRANISHDPQKMKELWTPLLKAWFPDGLEDSELSLINVQIESADIWDTPPSKVVQMAGLLKSAMTGKPYDQKTNKKEINLNSSSQSSVMTEEEKLDETIDESFPASDPPGHIAKSEEDLRKY